MRLDAPIFIAGHRGLAGSAILRRLQREGAERLLTRPRAELDLTRQSEVEAFFDAHDLYYVVEQSRDAQLRSLLLLETRVLKKKLKSLLVYGGFPLSAKHVVDEISRDQEG